MTPGLTEKQQKVLDYLKQKINTPDGIPSLRKAARDLGISHAAVDQLLKALEQKGCIRREGKYSRTLHILNRTGRPAAEHRYFEIPIIGHITAGVPMYAQQEWDGTVLADSQVYPGENLFALRVEGDSMKDAGILDGDIAICKPRQYAVNNEIVVALVHNEEATVKRFYLDRSTGSIELRPENPDFPVQKYGLDDILVQGKVIGVMRGPDGMERLH
ncbi:MAG: transcriptional repressor LexA [Desulfobacteraceae bacterium]